MKKPFLTSAQAAYEPPYAEIIEFAVEGGFTISNGFHREEGTEASVREDENEEDLWHWMS